MNVLILAVRYLEPEYAQTEAFLRLCQQQADAAGINTHLAFVDRKPKGIGSLAEAYNRGARLHNSCQYDYIWLVSNVTGKAMHLDTADCYPGGMLTRLVEEAYDQQAGAIHPSFDSDHVHLQPLRKEMTCTVPYVEFTAPLVDASLFEAYPLDENMPYWGHDLDWSHRVANAGALLLCDHAVELGHSYIRNCRKERRMHAVTLQRLMQRRKTDAMTRKNLVEKYGENWAVVLKYI